MNPDDRATDLRPDAAEWQEKYVHDKPLPPLSAHVDARTDAFMGRVLELTAVRGMNPDAAVAQTYREFNHFYHAEQHAPGWRDLSAGGKVALVVILAIVLAIVGPVLAYAVGNLLIPFWEWGFRRWL